MLLEANLLPSGAGFDTVVKDLLGRGWNIINGLSVAFMYYIYFNLPFILSGGGLTESFINQSLNDGNLQVIDRTFASLLFCIVLAIVVWFSTKAVDRFSTVLIVGMVISFSFLLQI